MFLHRLGDTYPQCIHASWNYARPTLFWPQINPRFMTSNAGFPLSVRRRTHQQNSNDSDYKACEYMYHRTTERDTYHCPRSRYVMFSCLASILGAVAVRIPHNSCRSSRKDASPKCSSCSSGAMRAPMRSAPVLMRSGSIVSQSNSLFGSLLPYVSARLRTLLML